MPDLPNDNPAKSEHIGPGMFSIGGVPLGYMTGWWSLNVPARVMSGKLPDGTPYAGSTTYLVVGIQSDVPLDPPSPIDTLEYTAILTFRYHVDKKVFDSLDQRKRMVGVNVGTEIEQIEIARGIMGTLLKQFHIPQSSLEELLVQGGPDEMERKKREQSFESLHTQTELIDKPGSESHFPGL